MKAIETIHKGLHRSSALGWSITTLICCITPSFAAEIHVPQDAPTIQAGIDLALSGDTVVVSCGTYSEALLLKSGVTLRSETGSPDCVTLDVAAGTAAMTADGDDDVVIEGIRVTSTAVPSRGLVARTGSSTTLRHCEFVDLETHGTSPTDRGGAAILLEGQSETEIEVCLFLRNEHSGSGNRYGGAICCINASSATIRSSSFLQNRSINGGGAIYSNNAAVSIDTSIFGENISSTGGAIDHEGSDFSLMLTDCTFERNLGEAGGGAVGTWTTVMERCRFVLNSAEQGGAVFAVNGLITDCSFSENQANQGTALYVISGALVRGTVFSRNSCLEDQCDGTAFLGSSIDALTLLNCTFAENRFVLSGTPAEIKGLPQSSFVLRNTLVAFSDGGSPLDQEAQGGELTVECSDFYGNSGGDWVGDVEGLNGVDGNISADPLFCSLPAHDYTLQAISPCAPLNSGGCDLIGALGVGCGTVHIDEMSWGSIMALYR